MTTDNSKGTTQSGPSLAKTISDTYSPNSRSIAKWKMSWLAEKVPEILRGALLGLIVAIAFALFAWEAPPHPKIGTPEHILIKNYGEPDERIGREGPKLGGIPPVRYLIYRNGLFNLSRTTIAINPISNVVMSVTQDDENGY